MQYKKANQSVSDASCFWCKGPGSVKNERVFSLTANLDVMGPDFVTVDGFTKRGEIVGGFVLKSADFAQFCREFLRVYDGQA